VNPDVERGSVGLALRERTRDPVRRAGIRQTPMIRRPSIDGRNRCKAVVRFRRPKDSNAPQLYGDMLFA